MSGRSRSPRFLDRYALQIAPRRLNLRFPGQNNNSDSKRKIDQ